MKKNEIKIPMCTYLNWERTALNLLLGNLLLLWFIF